MKKAVVILPTYNEKENIDRLIPILENNVFPHIKTYEMHILVADDNSPDGTADEVRKLMKKWKNIAISQGSKRGLGAAYVRAMTYAIEKMDADVMFEMDADGQHDESKIPQFLKKIDDGYDMVIGTRYSGGGSIPDNWPLQRKAFSIVANLFVRLVFMKFSIHDWTGGYRALRKEVFLKEKKELTNYYGYIFQISFLHKAVRDGFKIAEVPFHFSDRTLGNSKIASINYIFDVIRFVVITQIKEIIFGKFGKFLVVGGFGFILQAVILRMFVEYFHKSPEWSNLIGAAVAIFSNFNLNNIWTFKNEKITSVKRYFLKMIQFYATSAFGVIVLQTGTITLGDILLGKKFYFIYFLFGTALVLIWNFTIYNKFIWKIQHPKK